MKKIILLLGFFLLLIAKQGFSQTWDTSKTVQNALYPVTSQGDTANVLIGIGTATPQANLHVVGTALIHGQLTADSIVTPVIAPADSEIRFGHDAIIFNIPQNRIHWTPSVVLACGFRRDGLGIGNGATFANAINSMALGTNVQVNCGGFQSQVLGAGCALGPLVNNIPNSLMVGYNSTISTLFVGPSPCGGSGFVGIGTTTPISKLHVATPNGFITSDPLALINYLGGTAPDGLVIANGVGTMNSKIQLTGNTSQVLLGNGTWGAYSSGNVTSCAAGMTNYITKYLPGPNDICNSIMYDNGTAVGVNTTTPLTEFHVAGPTGFITTDPLSAIFLPSAGAVTDGLVIADLNGTLNRKINLTGLTTDVLRGDGTFGPGGGIGNLSSCAITPIQVDYLPKYTIPGPNPTVCLSQVLDNGTNVLVNSPVPLYGYDRMEVWGLDQFAGVPATGLLGSVYPNNTGLNIPFNYGLEGYLDLKRHALTNIGVDAEVYSNTTSYQNIGVNAIVTGTNDGASYTSTGSQVGVQVHSYGNALSTLPTYTIFNYGVSSEADDATATYGGDFYANGGNAIIPPPAPWVLTQTNGVSGRASGAQWNIGVTGSAVSNVNGIDDEGVYGIAASFNCLGGQVFGGKFETFCPTASCSGPTTGSIYGVFAYAPGPTSGPPNSWSCLPNTWHSYAGFFNGDLVYTGNFYNPSDSILKDSVQSITNGLSTLLKLQPKSFVYNNHYPEISLHGGREYGLIAQAVERVIPNSVDSAIIPARYDSLGNVSSPRVGVLALNYMELIPFLIAANKDLNDSVTKLRDRGNHQQLSIDSLRNTLNSIIACLDSICPVGSAAGGHAPVRQHGGGNGTSGNDASNGTINSQDVILTASNSPLLYQNTPNPFSSGTKINYYLPEGTMGAMIVFYDGYGTQLKEVKLSQTGNGTLNVTPDNLSNGIYSYSLIVNGKVIDTKRMVLSR